MSTLAHQVDDPAAPTVVATVGGQVLRHQDDLADTARHHQTRAVALLQRKHLVIVANLREALLDETLERGVLKVRSFLSDVRVKRLGPTEFRLLEFLMESTGRVLSRSQLLDGVWGRNAFVDERTVDVHIGRLRKALVRGREADPIRTVRGAGYVFGERQNA